MSGSLSRGLVARGNWKSRGSRGCYDLYLLIVTGIVGDRRIGAFNARPVGILAQYGSNPAININANKYHFHPVRIWLSSVLLQYHLLILAYYKFIFDLGIYFVVTLAKLRLHYQIPRQ